jgi:hypothetical protein
MRTSVTILGRWWVSSRPTWGFAPWWRFGPGSAWTDPRPSRVDHYRVAR